MMWETKLKKSINKQRYFNVLLLQDFKMNERRYERTETKHYGYCYTAVSHSL